MSKDSTKRKGANKGRKRLRGSERRPKPFSSNEPTRLGSNRYQEANVLEEILSDSDTPEDVRNALEGAVMSLSNATGVSATHPRVVRAAYIEMIRTCIAECDEKGCRTGGMYEPEKALQLLLQNIGYFDSATGRTHGTSGGLRFHHFKTELFHHVKAQTLNHVDAEAAAAPIENAKRSRRRRKHDTQRELAALHSTPANKVPIQTIKQALLLWTGFMLDISPGFMGALYDAIEDEWLKRVRGVLYEVDDMKDKRDRTCVALNTVMLEALREAMGQARGYEQSQDEGERESAARAAVFQSCADLFRRLAQSATENLAHEVRPRPLTLIGPDDDPTSDLADLRTKLKNLERVPENEAIALQMESEIYKLEQENVAADDEWPDVIGGCV